MICSIHFVIKKAELSLLYALCATLMQELDKRGRFSKVSLRGVYISQYLRLLIYGKAAGEQARLRTTFGKSDRVGSQGGLRKRGLWRRLTGTESGNAETAKPTPKVKRAVFLSRPRDHKNVYPILTGYNPVDNVVNIKYQFILCLLLFPVFLMNMYEEH